MKRLMAILLTLALLCGCGMAEETEEAELRQRYDAAVEMYNAREYHEAAEAFEALGDYADSARKLRASRYQEALALFKAEQYEEAIPLFEALGNYEKSRSYLNDATSRFQKQEYVRAGELYNQGEYGAAMEIYESISRFSDARKRAEQARAKYEEQQQAEAERKAYEDGLALLQAGEWINARDSFIQAGDYMDATDQMYVAVRMIAKVNAYAKADKLLEGGEYEAAAQWFDALGDYEDSAQRAQAIRDEYELREETEEDRTFREAVIQRFLWNRDEANELFKSLGTYNNAAGLVEKPFDRVTAKHLRDDATTPMSETFIAPDGSKHRYQIFWGVDTWRAAKTFCEILGGHMATMTTPEENDFVHSYMWNNGKKTAYFGLYDETRVGNWIWVTDEPLEYTNWHRGEPSRSAKERYGMYFYKHTDGTWNDAHFEEGNEFPICSFICEWDD